MMYKQRCFSKKRYAPKKAKRKPSVLSKVFCSLLFLLCFAVLLCSTALAHTTNEPSQMAIKSTQNASEKATTTITDATNATDTTNATDATNATNATDANITADATDEAPKNDDENTEKTGLGGFLDAYIGEIFCALTFIGSLFLALMYKVGLLPMLSRSLKALGSAVQATSGATKEFATKAEGELARLAEEITPALHKMDAIGKQMENSSEKIATMHEHLTTAQSERDRLFLLLNAQNEVLYGIMQSANLPQYQKDIVAKQYHDTKHSLEKRKETQE